MSKKTTVALLGIMGRTPFAGVAWQVLQYLEGFRRLGCDVYYIEDTGACPYDPEQNSITDDCRYTIKYIARLMARCGLADRWAYRSGPDGRTTFIISHRLSALENCDVQLMIENGRLVGLKLAVPTTDGHKLVLAECDAALRARKANA